MSQFPENSIREHKAKMTVQAIESSTRWEIVSIPCPRISDSNSSRKYSLVHLSVDESALSWISFCDRDGALETDA